MLPPVIRRSVRHGFNLIIQPREEMRLCTPRDVASHLLPTVYGWERVDAGDRTREFDFEYGSCGCGLATLAVQQRRSLESDQDARNPRSSRLDAN
jgi:hypothetical protein